MGNGVSGDLAADAHVIQLRLGPAETGFDIPKAFPVRQLSEGHAEELVQTGERDHLVVSVVPLYAFSEFVGGKELHQLSKDGSADIHGYPSPSAGVRKYGLSAENISNR